jgi:peptidoglycan/xylan/chitin deacetylase (PgdA/CDA1 family)
VRKNYRSLVLCYHAVTERWEHALALPADAIVAQVKRLLSRGYRPAAAAAAVRGDERVLHVTFDDAFTSVADVLPELDRLGVPVTIFACSDYAKDGRPLAVPELARDAERLPEELSTMTWEQLRELAAGGVEIGSHTRTHPHLTRLSDDELAAELRESRATIEAELGRPCRFFAYPYGEEDERVRQAARAAGYEAAFAVVSDERDVDPFAVPRVALFRSDRNRLRAALKTRPLPRRTIRAIRRPTRRA